MNIVIELGKFKFKEHEYVNPYWFTNDGKIHLKYDGEKSIINLNSLTEEHIKELYIANLENHIAIVEGFNEFLELYNRISQFKMTETGDSKQPINIDSVNKLRKDNKTLEAKRLLSKNAKTIISTIGKAIRPDNGEHGDWFAIGITDIEYLEIIKDTELQSRQPRTTVVASIDLRIDILKKHGINMSMENIEDVKYTPEKTIEIDLTKSNININDNSIEYL